MQLTCETKLLRQSLQAAVKIIKKDGLAKLRAKDGMLEIETAEQPEFVSARFKADIDTEGECIINPALLSELMNRLEDSCVVLTTIKGKDGKDSLLQIHYNLEKDETAKAELHISQDSTMVDIPKLVPEKSIEFLKNDFDTLLRKVIFASSKSETKLCSVNFLFEDGALFANATDKHIIAQKKVTCKAEDGFEVVVPTNILNQILAIRSGEKATVKMDIQSNLIRFEIGNITLINQLIDTKFPPVKRAIPAADDYDVKITINKGEALKAINRLSVFNKQNEPLVLNIEDGKVVLTTKTVIGGLKENIAHKNETNTEACKVGLNTNYLVNIINSIEAEDVEIKWRQANTQRLLFEDSKDKNVRYVLSPVRLSA